MSSSLLQSAALPVSVVRNGHRTFLKWHRGRRCGSDPVFTGSRILEGMAAGASVEVDLVVTGDAGFAVLHDLTLDRETTGSGPVASASDAALRQLQLRGNDGHPIGEAVMLLSDLSELMVSGPVAADALLQLDYKEDARVLTPRAVDNFAQAVAPVARNVILSSGDAAAVRLLADGVAGLRTGFGPGRDLKLRTGFDPSDEEKFRAALSAGLLEDFVADALAAAPGAELIYLHWQMVTSAADAGFDLVGAFHAEGKRIDAWTIRQVDAESLVQVQRLLELRVDQITTDDPEGLLAALETTS